MGVLNEGVPFGTTKDQMTISDLRSEVGELKHTVREFLTETNPARREVLREELWECVSGRPAARNRDGREEATWGPRPT